MGASGVTRAGRGVSGGAYREIKAIRALLEDSYNVSAIVRELVQNADDAGATRIEFVVLRQGLASATNSLLHGPALLVTNDGAFSAADREALHQAIGGSKEDDASKIGMFGVGLKSVFHICEAFAYIGANASSRTEGILNPWTGTGASLDDDPVHPDWNDLADDDKRQLWAVAQLLLGGSRVGLLLWLPLRRAEHLDRGEEGQYGLSTERIEPDDMQAWFDPERDTSAALLLAQCRHLRRIVATWADRCEDVRTRKQISHVDRLPPNEVWLGRHSEDEPRPSRPFQGAVVAGDRRWCVIGAEAVGSDRLRQLREDENWPTVESWRDGRQRLTPRKGLAQAAVTVLKPILPPKQTGGTYGVRLRWAAFLPLNDDPNPAPSAIVENFGGVPAWEIILHGFFWPSQDRRSIPGVTDGGDGDEIRIRWNQAIRDELLLPLLPSVLEQAVAGEDQKLARELLRQIVKFRVVGEHGNEVRQDHWLLPAATADGVRYVVRRRTQALRVVSIPHWMKAEEVLRQALATTWEDFSDDIVVIDDDAPSLAGQATTWTVDALKCLFSHIPIDAFRSASSLNWIADLVSHVLSGGAESDGRAALVAERLGRVIGDLVLAPSARQLDRDAFLEAWRTLCATLPARWLGAYPCGRTAGHTRSRGRGRIRRGFIPVAVRTTRRRGSTYASCGPLGSSPRCLGQAARGRETVRQRQTLSAASRGGIVYRTTAKSTAGAVFSGCRWFVLLGCRPPTRPRGLSLSYGVRLVAAVRFRQLNRPVSIETCQTTNVR